MFLYSLLCSSQLESVHSDYSDCIVIVKCSSLRQSYSYVCDCVIHILLVRVAVTIYPHLFYKLTHFQRESEGKDSLL